MVDTDPARLDVSRRFGATDTVDASAGDAVEQLLALTGGQGVDVAVEAVGVAATFDTCQSIIAPGGRVANVGVHGKPVEPHLEKLWSRNSTLSTGWVCTHGTPILLDTVVAGKVKPEQLVAHRFALDDVLQACEVFGNAARQKAMKVILVAE